MAPAWRRSAPLIVMVQPVRRVSSTRRTGPLGTATPARRRIRDSTVRARAAGDRPEGARGPLISKGSITVDGVSLTVSAIGDDWFEVSLIPTTLGMTTLGRAAIGTPVNLEVDVIAKYVERLLAHKT